jgi:transposase-like protein
MPVPSEQTQDPRLWPAEQRPALVQELAQGRDTVAGLAQRHGLPVSALLQGWDGAGRDSLLMPGIRPQQSRAAGPC